MPTRIPGLRLYLDVLSPEEEDAVLARLEENGWEHTLARATQQFGWTYPHLASRTEPLAPAAPIPDWLTDVLDRAHTAGIVLSTTPDQVRAQGWGGGRAGNAALLVLGLNFPAEPRSFCACSRLQQSAVAPLPRHGRHAKTRACVASYIVTHAIAPCVQTAAHAVGSRGGGYLGVGEPRNFWAAAVVTSFPSPPQLTSQGVRVTNAVTALLGHREPVPSRARHRAPRRRHPTVWQLRPRGQPRLRHHHAVPVLGVGRNS